MPKGCKVNYSTHYTWGKFKNIIEEESSIIDVKEDEYRGLVSSEGSIIIGGNQSIEVFDMTGRVVYSGSTETIPTLTPGIYILRINGKSISVQI